MSHRRKIGDDRRLRRTYRATRHSCISGVYYDRRKYRLIRFYQGKRAKYLRRCSNKKVRRTKETYQRGQYRKVFDYWWRLW